MKSFLLAIFEKGDHRPGRAAHPPALLRPAQARRTRECACDAALRAGAGRAHRRAGPQRGGDPGRTAPGSGACGRAGAAYRLCRRAAVRPRAAKRCRGPLALSVGTLSDIARSLAERVAPHSRSPPAWVSQAEMGHPPPTAWRVGRIVQGRPHAGWRVRTARFVPRAARPRPRRGSPTPAVPRGPPRPPRRRR